MGGSGSLITSVFSSVLGSALGGRDDSVDEERKARAREQAAEEAKERRRAREKVLEARDLEARRSSESTLSRGATALSDDPEVGTRQLKTKLGE